MDQAALRIQKEGGGCQYNTEDGNRDDIPSAIAPTPSFGRYQVTPRPGIRSQLLARWPKSVPTAHAAEQHANNMPLPLEISLVTGYEPYTVTQAAEKNGIKSDRLSSGLGFCFRSSRPNLLFAVSDGLPHLSRPPEPTQPCATTLEACG